MTAPNATPALTLAIALAKARRLNYLLEALDTVAANLDGNLPKTQCITTLNAHNSIQPFIETINEKARGPGVLDWDKISVASCWLMEYSADMNRYGTIADLTRWAEETLPGEESRGRSVIVGCRKAGLITKGGHGRNAPFMQDGDFATAILAVLHSGQVTQVHEAVPAYAKMPLALVRVEDPSEGTFDTPPENIQGNDALRPYFARFRYPLSGLGNLESVLILLFHLHAAHEDFSAHDYIELHTMADKVAVRIVLHGGMRYEASGWPGSGPDHSQVTFYFGAFDLFGGRFLKTTRTIYADALNALSLMTPGLTKQKPEAANV